MKLDSVRILQPGWMIGIDWHLVSSLGSRDSKDCHLRSVVSSVEEWAWSGGRPRRARMRRLRSSQRSRSGVERS
jgi:hypothetical protein